MNDRPRLSFRRAHISAAVHSIQIKESWHARPVSSILGDHKSGMFFKIVNVRSTFAFELCIVATNFDGIYLITELLDHFRCILKEFCCIPISFKEFRGQEVSRRMQKNCQSCVVVSSPITTPRPHSKLPRSPTHTVCRQVIPVLPFLLLECWKSSHLDRDCDCGDMLPRGRAVVALGALT